MRIFHSLQLYHVTTVSSAICKGTLSHQGPTVIGYFTTAISVVSKGFNYVRSDVQQNQANMKKRESNQNKQGANLSSHTD